MRGDTGRKEVKQKERERDYGSLVQCIQPSESQPRRGAKGRMNDLGRQLDHWIPLTCIVTLKRKQVEDLESRGEADDERRQIENPMLNRWKA